MLGLFKRVYLLALSAWFVFWVSAANDGRCGQPEKAGNRDSTPVELKILKYGGLCSAVRAQLGRVVVVDVWGEF